jgi:hypothetical protein
LCHCAECCYAECQGGTIKWQGQVL